MNKIQIDVKNIIKLYKSGQSCAKIAKQFNVSETFISQKLKDNKIVKRSNSVYRKRKFNENFFEDINTEEKAYWLGFLYADGCVQITKRNQYIVTLAVKDKEVIDNFIKSLKADFITKTYNDVYVITLTSKQMVNSLINHGCVPKKSLVLTFPSTISNILIPHFIRGYFDGDGSVYNINPRNYNKTKTKYFSLGVNICGTGEFLIALNKIFKNNYKIRKEKRLITNTYSLYFSGTNKCKSFYDFIYKNATIYLQRKKNKFDNYFKERGSTTIISYPIKKIG